MSAPHSPGGVVRVRASRSQAAITSAPCACARSASARSSSVPASRPSAPGVWTTTANASTCSSASSSGPSDRTDLEPQSGRAGRHDPDGLRQGVAVEQQHPPRLDTASGQGHRLGDRGGLVEQAGAGGGQPGQVGDHGLEVEQRLEPALADLGLVRRVGGVPGRVLEHVPADHRRGDRAVVAEPDHRGQRVVPGGEVAQRGQGLGLRQRRRQLERPVHPDRLRHGLLDQVVQIGQAERGKHLVALVGLRADVPGGEGCGLESVDVQGRERIGHGASFRACGGGRCHRARRRRSPSVTRWLQSCLAYAVWVPERFRGCCPFGGTTLDLEPMSSPALSFQRC